MKIFALLALLIFATAAFPQSANVIQLAPEDASSVRKAYVELQNAQRHWDDIKFIIDSKYVLFSNCSSPDRQSLSDGVVLCGTPSRVTGFENGFEFSKDFRFIVPKQSSGVTHAPCSTTDSVTYWGGCITLTPNVFTTTPTYGGPPRTGTVHITD